MHSSLAATVYLHRMNAERVRIVVLLVVAKRHCRAWSTDSLCREYFQLH